MGWTGQPQRDGQERDGQSAAPGERLRAWAQLARSVGERLPGGRLVFAGLDAAEHAVLAELRWRLAQLEPQHADAPAHDGAAMPATLAELMQRSLDQRPDSAERVLLNQLVAQLVPDEARILAALSDGSRIAVCHLDGVSRLGVSHARVVAFASRVGAEAGVMLGDRVPYYLSHLLELSLVQAGPEDRALAPKYELIENDTALRMAADTIGKDLGLRPRVVRATVALSPLGQRLWERCAPGNE